MVRGLRPMSFPHILRPISFLKVMVTNGDAPQSATVLLQALCRWFLLVARPEKALLVAKRKHWTHLLRLAMTQKVEPYSPNSSEGIMQDCMICSNRHVIPYTILRYNVYMCVYTYCACINDLKCICIILTSYTFFHWVCRNRDHHGSRTDLSP